MSRRGSSPVVGVAVLVVVTVVLAGAVVASLGALAPADPPPQAALSLSVDADADRIRLRHRGGDALDVRSLRIRVAVDGTALAHQPPVPFFAARGFRAGPTGPFNPAADPRWTPGEAAGFRLASTNAPAIDPGVRVRVEVYADDRLVARLSAVAG